MMAWAKHQEQLCNRRDGGEESPSPATVFSERENGWHGWSKYCWWVVTDHFFFKTSVKAHYVPNVYVCQGKCISYVYLQLYACDCVRSFDFWTISLNTFTYVDLCSIPCPNQADQESQARLEEVDQGLVYPQALLIGLF